MLARIERRALITGGSSGIGLAIARALGRDGYGLTLAARRPKRLEGAVEELRADGIGAAGIAADVAVEEDVAALFRGHAERCGRLDVLVNNAGAGIATPIERAGGRQLDKLLAANLRAPVLCTREALPMLRRAGAEHGNALIVNVASASGLEGRAGLAAYAATKAGLIAFSRSAHRELSGAGIKCTALAPGAVDTPMMATYRQRVPAERMIRPRDLGEAVRFLLRTSRNCHVPLLALALPSEEAAPARPASRRPA